MENVSISRKKNHDELRADGFLFCANGLSLNPGDIVRMPGWRKSPHAGKYARVVKLHPIRGELGKVTVQFAGETKSATILPAHVVSRPLRSRLSQRKVPQHSRLTLAKAEGR